MDKPVHDNLPPTALPTPAPRADRWWVLTAILLVLLMAPLDASAVNVVLPVLQCEFALALAHVAWVSLVYLVVLASLILPMGRLGDLFGFRRLYLTGAVLFTLASLGCGLAPSFPWLIAARVVQASGACMLMALSSALTTRLFPSAERGRALGIQGMAVAFGLVLGPTLGGLLTSLGGWRLIFFINLPIGIIGSLACYRMLPRDTPRGVVRVDWPGALCAVGMLSTFMLALTQGEVWGWDSPATLGVLAGSALCTVAFVWVERRAPAPMLDFGLFRHPVFAGANIALTMNYLGQFCATFLVPKLLEDGMHLRVGMTGMVMIVQPLGVLLLAPISGMLSDRLGTRQLAVAGELLVALGLAGLAWSAGGQSLAPIIAALATIGVGAGLFQAPNNSAIMGSVPKTHLGIGGGVLATMRNVGMALGITVSSLVVMVASRHYQAQALPGSPLFYGIRMAFLAGAGFALVGVLTSALRADHPQRGEA